MTDPGRGSSTIAVDCNYQAIRIYIDQTIVKGKAQRSSVGSDYLCLWRTPTIVDSCISSLNVCGCQNIQGNTVCVGIGCAKCNRCILCAISGIGIVCSYDAVYKNYKFLYLFSASGCVIGHRHSNGVTYVSTVINVFVKLVATANFVSTDYNYIASLYITSGYHSYCLGNIVYCVVCALV